MYCSETYHVVSTGDLEHWTIYDEAIHGKDIPWFADPDAPKYPGNDWENPTQFMKNMRESTEEDTYYSVFADIERGKPTALGYATGKSPLGPFQYQGIIIDNAECDPSSWNNHGSIECVNEKWYVFYHRSSRNTKIFRRLCIEPITINSDGTIDEVVMTSQGPGKPFAPGEEIMGYQACGLRGTIYIDEVKKADYEEQGKAIGECLSHIDDFDEAIFRYVENEKEYRKIKVKASGSRKI